MVTYHMEVGDFFNSPSGTSYECTRQVMTGGFGEVYFVKDTKTGVEVVAKLPKLDDPAKVDYITRKQRQEGQILEDLTIKGVDSVVNFIDAFDCTINGKDMPVLVMEKARGMTVMDWIQANGTMPEDAVKLVLEKLAIGLRDVHLNGYIHRDIKSPNVFIDGDLSDPIITIIDFGISAQFDDSRTVNEATNRCFSSFYAPPEQRTHNEAKPSTDVFAVAAIGFELLVGTSSHPGGMDSRYAPQEYSKQSVSDDFNEVIRKATWDNPDLRYKVMDDFILALRGKPLMIHMPRIIAEKAYPLENDEYWICRRTDRLSTEERIQVNEKTDPAGPYLLSRWHAVIRKGDDGIYRLFDQGVPRPGQSAPGKSTNGTVWRRKATNEWQYIPEAGLPLAGKSCEIGLGFTKHPPKHTDKDGHPILPGAYRTIEYCPPDRT